MKKVTFGLGPIARPEGAGKRHFAALATSVAAVALVAPHAAFAESESPSAPAAGGIEEIVVTAQKREQALQDVPIAISAITAQALQANRVESLGDINGLVPNLQVKSLPGGAAAPSFSMRGAINSSSVAGADRGVAVYIDGVYLGSNNGSLFDVVDITRIEVLRGPQGTLFGHNSTAGAISFVTAEPSGQFGVKQQFTYGNFDQFRSSTRINTPQWGPLSASFSYTHTQRRGDIRNLGGGTKWDFTPAFNGIPTFYTSPDWLGNENTEGFGASVKLELDRFKAVYRFDHSDSVYSGGGWAPVFAKSSVTAQWVGQTNPLSAISPERPEAVNNWDTVPSTLKVSGHNLTMSYEVSDSLKLKSITGYRTNNSYAPWDNITGIGGLVNLGTAAFAAIPAAVRAATVGAPFIPRLTSSQAQDRQWSEEIQANYSSNLLTLTVGGIYYWQKLNRSPAGVDGGIGRARSGSNGVFPNFAVPYSGQLQNAVGRETILTVQSTAFYGQAELHVTPQIDVVGGLRYTKDKKTGIDRSLMSGTSAASVADVPLFYEDDEISFNVNVNYKPTDDILLYAKYSTGYISGGALAGLSYDPERAKSWEAGLKADWFDHKLQTNIAAFSMKYEGMQIAVGGTLLVPARPDIPQALISGATARVKGLEVETILAPSRNWLFTANLGHLDFKFSNVDPRLTLGYLDYVPVNRPKWSASLSGQYTSEPVVGDARVVARLDANWRSEQRGAANVPAVGVAATTAFTQAEQDQFIAATTIKPYWLVNGRLALQGIDLSGSAKATVALWAKNIFDNRSPSYMLSLLTSVAASYEPARTFGLDVTLEF